MTEIPGNTSVNFRLFPRDFQQRCTNRRPLHDAGTKKSKRNAQREDARCANIMNQPTADNLGSDLISDSTTEKAARFRLPSWREARKLIFGLGPRLHRRTKSEPQIATE